MIVYTWTVDVNNLTLEPTRRPTYRLHSRLRGPCVIRRLSSVVSRIMIQKCSGGKFGWSLQERQRQTVKHRWN